MSGISVVNILNSSLGVGEYYFLWLLEKKCKFSPERKVIERPFNVKGLKQSGKNISKVDGGAGYIYTFLKNKTLLS